MRWRRRLSRCFSYWLLNIVQFPICFRRRPSCHIQRPARDERQADIPVSNLDEEVEFRLHITVVSAGMSEKSSAMYSQGLLAVTSSDSDSHHCDLVRGYNSSGFCMQDSQTPADAMNVRSVAFRLSRAVRSTASPP